MIKRIWGALDTILSTVGFATLVLLGLRLWRGLPVLPANLMSAPVATSVASVAKDTQGPSAPKPRSAVQTPAPAEAEAQPSPPLDAPWRQSGGGGLNYTTGASNTASSKDKEPHDWARELSVTVNASRYVKSMAELAPGAATLPEAGRKSLREAVKMASGHEMLLVCNVTVEYSGTTEVSLDQAGFRLVSPEREVFPAIPLPFTTRQLSPLRASLLANGSARGDLVFAVKRGVQPDEILYQP